MTYQTRTQSAVESITSTGIGYIVAVASQLVVFPLCGVYATGRQTLTVAAYFTLISVIRQYAVRRWFNRQSKDAQ